MCLVIIRGSHTTLLYETTRISNDLSMCNCKSNLDATSKDFGPIVSATTYIWILNSQTYTAIFFPLPISLSLKQFYDCRVQIGRMKLSIVFFKKPKTRAKFVCYVWIKKLLHYLAHWIQQPITKLQIRIFRIFWPLKTSFISLICYLFFFFKCNLIAYKIQEYSGSIVSELVVGSGEARNSKTLELLLILGRFSLLMTN